MHCVSSYPCANENANINRINWLKSLHNRIGYSDHTSSTIVPALTVPHGVSSIEKHFTTDKSLPGRDNKFALNPNEFSEMCSNIRIAEKAIIDHGKKYQEIENMYNHQYKSNFVCRGSL